MGSIGMLLSALGAFYVFSSLVRDLKQRWELAGIPTVGEDSLFGSLLQPIRSLWNSKEVVQEGYNKYRNTGGIFKFRAFGGWKVALASPRYIEDMRKAPDGVLSSLDALAEVVEMDYTLGKPIHYDPFQVDVVKGSLTRNVQGGFASVRDEIVTAFGELLPPQDDWVPINLNPTMQHVICRASNRFFIGLPLCRDPDYIDLNVKFAIKVGISAQLLYFIPEVLKPILGDVVSPLSSTIKRAKKQLGPIIQERLDQQKEHDGADADWPEKPNDMISWILEEARGHPSRWNVDDILLRILFLNFAAIHTTSMTLTNTLDYLARYPEYIPKLREEIESVTEEHGWTKQAMGQMRKLDSFLKEVQRVNPNMCFGVERKVLRDLTLSDGTTIPRGTTIGVPNLALQMDKTNIPDGDKFIGFRYADKRDSETEESIKRQIVTPTTDIFLFGYGRHACPGRFFAVNELKALVAHILLTYDIKAETPGVGARMMWFGYTAMQDNSIKYLFRKRRGD